MRDPEISYRHGLAVLRHTRDAPDWMAWDERTGAWVAPGYRLPDLRVWARDRGVVRDAPDPEALDGPLFDPRAPRDYQQEALTRWLGSASRGSVVLPTGAGKSFLAILAIHRSACGTCVVAPTRALVHQWFGQLADAFGAERVGAFYGDEKEVRSITVTTYHSAFGLLERHGDRFGLLILDEVHHLADAADGGGKAWHDALRIAPAGLRLGLTATYPDDRDAELRRLVGPVVYRRTVGEMTDAQLAGFVLERRFVALSPEDRARYDALTETYESFLDEKRYRERYPEAGDAWRVFMAETRTSPRARRAFRAFRERERIVALPGRKLDEAARLLRLFPAEQALLFCGGSAAAERVSRHFAIPLVAAHTPASERHWILERVSTGEIRAVASVRVLDEGWDVPTAKLGIVLGDSTRGSPRQFAQRLGRLLRRQGDRVASLFEIVVADTHEFYASQKRRKGLGRAAGRQLGLGI